MEVRVADEDSVSSPVDLDADVFAHRRTRDGNVSVERKRPTSVLRGSNEPTTWSICPRACITDITAPMETPASPRSIFCRVDREMPARTASSSALRDRKSTRLHSSHVSISYVVFCLQTK